MADLKTADSTYGSTGIDTHTDLVNDPGGDNVDAEYLNRLASAIIAIETALGAGETLKGSKSDLVARLAVALGADGKLAAFSASTLSTFPIPVSVGGTNQTTFGASQVIISSADGLSLTNESPLAESRGGTGQTTLAAAVTPIFSSVGQTAGPSSAGSGSTRTHEGDITISSNQNLSGVHFYEDFVLNASTTITVPAGERCVIIVADTSITINGTIDAEGAGGAGATGIISSNGPIGESGTDQAAGGGGGGTGGFTGGAGGDSLSHGIVMESGGAGGGTGGTATARTSSLGLVGFTFMSMVGGAGGGAGGSDASGTPGDGGNGGGSIVLIAPTITLGASSTLKTSGEAGGTGTSAGGGGGGGAGNIYMLTQTFTDSGATFTQAGGAGGTFITVGTNGGPGAAGFKQILIYG